MGRLMDNRYYPNGCFCHRINDIILLKNDVSVLFLFCAWNKTTQRIHLGKLFHQYNPFQNLFPKRNSNIFSKQLIPNLLNLVQFGFETTRNDKSPFGIGFYFRCSCSHLFCSTINSSHVISPDLSAETISLTISSSACFGNNRGIIALLDTVVVRIFLTLFHRQK